MKNFPIHRELTCYQPINKLIYSALKLNMFYNISTDQSPIYLFSKQFSEPFVKNPMGFAL